MSSSPTPTPPGSPSGSSSGATLPRSADEIRRAFTDYFVDRGHTEVASASLIPHDPTVLFTVAGMVPFKSYFTGDEAAPYKRAVTAQKCARAGGKHNDLDDVGRTARHLVFFEMLGNFSFGDYFKDDAIPFAWQFYTELLGIDPDRLWVTVHDSDDEAEQIWHDKVGVPMDRIQRMGDKDNFWQMGETGPCGPCSEIFFDKGAQYGDDGGPKFGGDERFVEIWNLVFMQYNQTLDGSRTRLPKPSIDTGAGLERNIMVMQGVDSVWETDLMVPLIDKARSITGKVYVPGDYADRTSFSLRVLAEHARSSTMLVSDGVFPSNEARGYVLRRIIRRAVRHAYLLGVDKLVLPSMVDTAIEVMGDAYPAVRASRDMVVDIITREEEQFRRTLRNGLAILDELVGSGLEERILTPTSGGFTRTLPGSVAFKLHDTYGFPLEVTQEIAEERGVGVDLDGFTAEMDVQRKRAKDARKGARTDTDRVDAYREIVERRGITTFLGYTESAAQAEIVGIVPGDALADGMPTVEIFLDRTPFYAESGGQIGDTGTISTESGVATVLDTTFALPGLRRHIATVTGTVEEGQTATAAIDTIRRDAIRRNHTGTHVLHWALREVLGEHVKQQGSLVAPDRLRFDFSHFAGVTADEITRIEQLANGEVLANDPVAATEMPKAEAEKLGAIAFFGDKYGDSVRVLTAGPSLEFCGGTHVRATGEIGMIKIISEGSIGSGIRRIEAVTGTGTLARMQRVEATLTGVAKRVGTTPESVMEGIDKRDEELERHKLRLTMMRSQQAFQHAEDLARAVVDGVVVVRVDDYSPSDLRELALAVRAQPGVRAAVLAGISDTGGVSLVAAVMPDAGIEAAALIRDAAKAVGGGGGGKGDVATAGGKNPDGLDDALRIARAAAGI